MLRFKKVMSITLAAILVFTYGIIVPGKHSQVKAASVNVVYVDPALQYQTIDGWGTSLAWWADLVGRWSTNAKNEIIDLAFDPDKGLGLNIVRYNIGGGDDPTHNHMRPGGAIEGYEPSPGVWNWDADPGQRWVLQQAKAKIPANIFIAEAFSNSPPYWMTKSGCASGAVDGGNNLRDDQYDNFADYFTEVIKHFRDYWGINFQTADPMNEPTSNWWKANGSQEGCAFDTTKQAEIIEKVHEQLVKKGLNTKISASDETSIDTTINTINSFSDEIKSYIGQINTHEYGGSKRTALRDLAASLGKPLYMDEICTGYGNHDHNNIDSGLALADYIFKDLRDMKVNAWEIWQVVDDEAQDIETNANWGLIHAYWSGPNVEKYYVTKQYYAVAQFSKFIRPGYKIIDANNSNVVSAYDAKSQTLVLVARNTSQNSSDFLFDLSKFNSTNASVKAYRTSANENLTDVSGLSVSNGCLKDNLPSKSIVTYVISDITYNGGIGTTINDNVLGTNNNQFDYSSANAWKYYDAQSGAYSNDVHYSNTKDSFYQVRFSGNQVKIFGTKASDSGIAAISIDNGPEVRVDTYSQNRMDNVLIYTSPLLNPGQHILKVRVAGDMNINASDCYIVADRVVAIEGSTGVDVLQRPLISSIYPGDGRLTV